MSDARGSFRVEGVPTGVARVRVTAAGHAPAQTSPFSVAVGGGVSVGTIELSRGTEVACTVRTLNGAPAAGARLRFVSDDGDASEHVTDALGRVLVPSLSPGGYVVTLGARRVRVEIPDVSGAHELALDLFEGVVVTGRVLRAGAPVAYATLLLETLGERPTFVRTSTDEDGAFAFEAVPPGTAELVVVPYTGTEVVRRLDLPETPEHFLELRLPSASVHGNTRAESDGLPLPGAVVRLLPTDALVADEAVTTSDDAGEFVFEGVAAGEWKIDAVSGSGRPLRGHVLVSVAEDESVSAVVIELSAGTDVVARLLDENGRALGAGWLVAYAGDVEVGRAWPADGGTARVEGLPAGEVTLHARAPGRGTVTIGPLRLRRGETLDLGTVTLKPAATLVVTVVGPRLEPRAGVEVTLVTTAGLDPRPLRPVPARGPAGTRRTASPTAAARSTWAISPRVSTSCAPPVFPQARHAGSSSGPARSRGTDVWAGGRPPDEPDREPETEPEPGDRPARGTDDRDAPRDSAR